ncbi:MAG: XRE family transcriptional regulator [Clostridia bacterium]|nr:XRE family transcriptional regulator [Clostridia bacterium]MBP3531977.1 XRE family transcriptional regulator [Thermoguttaceae bacterium]
METLAKRIQRLRNTLNLNQTDFAGRIGRKQQTIGGWERGDRVPDYAIAALVQTFGVSERWLRTGDGEMFEARADVAAAFASQTERTLAEQFLLKKFRELSPELQNDVLGFCAFLIDENAKHLKKCLDEVADASSESGNVGDDSTP